MIQFLPAAISALGSVLGGRKERKAQAKADKAALEAQRQQRAWDVEDRDKNRAFDLEDRSARQALLNPYAAYYQGERLAKPVIPEPALAPAPAVIPQRPYGGGREFDRNRIGTQLR